MSQPDAPASTLLMRTIAWLMIVVAISIAACGPAAESPEKLIVGRWLNDKSGTTVEFLPDGTAIGSPPQTVYKYSFLDNYQTLRLQLSKTGESATVEVMALTKDQLKLKSDGYRESEDKIRTYRRIVAR